MLALSSPASTTWSRRSSRRCPRTRRAYDGDIRDFARYVYPELAAPDPRQAVGLLVASGPGGANLLALGYRKVLEARGLSSATVARRLSALRSAVEFAGTLGLVEWTLRIKRPRVEAYRDVRGPGRDGWRRMVEQLVGERKGADEPGPMRGRCVILLWYVSCMT